MISKYFSPAWVLALNLLLFSSCLNSSSEEVEYSPDAQIYAFSLSSATDSTDVLSATQFTIDQINGKIFNKEPLPYLFYVDSVVLNITGSSTYSPFSAVKLTLNPDSSYNWIKTDSVDINRLQRITTTAPDGVTNKSYDFELRIHQEDPYILSWEQKKSGYLPLPFDSQKTIAFKNRFITYFKSGSIIKALSSDASDGTNWSTANLTGLSPTLTLSSLTPTQAAVFGLDSTTGTVYQSTDGVNWGQVITPHTVKAIYGELPLATHGAILATAEVDGQLTFVQTDDFTVLTPLNKAPTNLPVKDFSVTKVDLPTFYSKYLIVTGGTTTENIFNNLVWIFLENNGSITHILSRIPNTVSLIGSSLFFYDDKPYLMITASGKNKLMYSENFGLDWVETAENQLFPENFTQRTSASVITDEDNYIWIFGGISGTQTQLADIWRGRLNKFDTN